MEGMSSIMGRYSFLSSTESKKAWKSLSLRRRSGVLLPLFSLRMEDDCGIGDFSSLKTFISWCSRVGFSIVQLLPLGDTHETHSPYDTVSSFACDPVYLSLRDIPFLGEDDYQEFCETLGSEVVGVDYAVKQKKIDFLRRFFRANRDHFLSVNFAQFCQNNKHWLDAYALFKVLKEFVNRDAWWLWEKELRDLNSLTLSKISSSYSEEVFFVKWLQYMCFCQFTSIKSMSEGLGIFLKGDLPFLVSRDSSDCWQYPRYFDFSYEVGAPPDMFAPKGQRWGLPAYNWKEILNDGGQYLMAKVSYMENFFHLYRLDHVIGLFRLWRIPFEQPLNFEGCNGEFFPLKEQTCLRQGRQLLSALISSSPLLACAEDLGVVPEQVREVLKEMGVLGIDVHRWMRRWDEDASFVVPECYRLASVACSATHDTSTLVSWLRHEVGAISESFFDYYCEQKSLDCVRIKNVLFESSSINSDFLKVQERIGSFDDFMWEVGVPHEEAVPLKELYYRSTSELSYLAKFCGLSRDDIIASEHRVRLCLPILIRKLSCSSSLFHIELLQDWLAVAGVNDYIENDCRINRPGESHSFNWSWRLHSSMESIFNRDVNKAILNFIVEGKRFHHEKVLMELPQ